MESVEATQFKDQLYSTFKQAGLINKLKSTLRKNLLDKLQLKSLNENSIKKQQIPFVLTKKVITCIISEYLLKNNHEYTVSILLPESNLDKSQLLSHDQIFKLLGIESWQYQGIHSHKHNFTVLDCLIYMSSCQFKKSVQNVCIGSQNDFDQPLAQKLQKIQQDYLKQMQSEHLNRSENLEQILQKQKANITELMLNRFEVEKKMLSNEIQSRVRRQQGSRWSNLSLNAQKQQDAQYQKKLLDLKSRQKDVLQRLQKRRKQVETEISNLRTKQLQMIKKYQIKTKQLDVQFRKRIKDIEIKQKDIQKQQLQIRAKKKQYEDCIRMVRQKVIEET